MPRTSDLELALHVARPLTGRQFRAWRGRALKFPRPTRVVKAPDVAPARHHHAMSVFACGQWWDIKPWSPK